MSGDPEPSLIGRPATPPLMRGIPCAVDWQAAARRTQGAAAYAFLVLLLAVSTEALGIALGARWLLQLSKWIAATVAVLELSVIALGTPMAVKAACYFVRHRKRLSQTDVRGLWRLLRSAIPLLAWSWLLTVATMGLPLIMDLPARLPESELVFVPVMLCFGVQWIRLAILVNESDCSPAIYTFVA